MEEKNIFNNYVYMDVFCMDIIEAWIEYRQNKGKEVSSDKFLEWVENELYPALECNFDYVYEDEFGHREDEE